MERRQKEILTKPRYTHKSPDATCLLPVFYRATLRWRNSMTGQFLQRKIWSLSYSTASRSAITPVFCLSQLISFCHPPVPAPPPPSTPVSPLLVPGFLLVLYIPTIMFHSLLPIHLHVALLISSHLLPLCPHPSCFSSSSLRVISTCPSHFHQLFSS